MKKNIEYHAKQFILEILNNYRGEGNCISRIHLRVEVSTNLRQNNLITKTISDQTLCSLIDNLRLNDINGAWICTTHQGGYFMARDIQEFDKFASANHRTTKNKPSSSDNTNS